MLLVVSMLGWFEYLSMDSNFRLFPTLMLKLPLPSRFSEMLAFPKLLFPNVCFCDFEILPNAWMPLWVAGTVNCFVVTDPTFLLFAAGGIATSSATFPATLMLEGAVVNLARSGKSRSRTARFKDAIKPRRLPDWDALLGLCSALWVSRLSSHGQIWLALHHLTSEEC